MADSDKTYTEAEFQVAIAERDAIKANRDEVLKEKKRLTDIAKSFEGVDVDEFKQLKADAEERARKKATDEGDFTKLQQQMAEKHAAELAAAQKRTGKALTALEKRKVAKLQEELVKAGALPEFMDLLTLKGAASVRLREGDEDWDEYVSDEKGNPLVADGAGTPMTLGQFVEANLKTQYAGAFKGSGSSGGGATKSTGSAGGAVRQIASTNSPEFLANLKAIRSGDVTVGS